ncbi:MAG: hypothetical protein ACREM1_22660 [Longimicrobiales bacterium]
MRRYRDVHGDSGVVAYDPGPDFIKVRFKHGETYVYNYESTGRFQVERMKVLAVSGEGLSAFISKFVKENYARRET